MHTSRTWARFRRAAGRPDGLITRTRWLFLLMCGLTLLLSLPPVLATADGVRLLLLAAAVCAFALSWGTTYARGRSLVVLDVVEALGMCAFALACPDPSLVFGVAFALLWFRAVHGSTRRAVLQCTGSVAGLFAAVLLWDLLPGNAALHPASFAGAVPIMFTTLAVARHLALSMFAREEATRRDAVSVELGTRLLGLTDAGAILAEARRATHAICDVTPGLRVVAVVPRDGHVRVLGAAGPVRQRPAILPCTVLAEGLPPGGATVVHDTAALDAAAGRSCRWWELTLPAGTDVHLLVGAPRKVADEVLLSLRSLSNQIALAQRNSAVHRLLTTQARTDALTGLANRASFYEELATAVTAPQGLVLLFLDLDDFKAVNDGLGHAAGDDVLHHVARRLREVSRPGDLCARVGGDEFALLLRGMRQEDAVAVGHRLVELVSAPLRLSHGTARIGASVGLAPAAPAVSAEQLLHRADTAMYAAKAAGKNRVQLFHDDLGRICPLLAEREAALARRGG